MNNLMNINADYLYICEIDQDIKVGDLIHEKGQYITNWGKTWKVTRITPKQVHCVLESLWYPVFEETAFGRVADGENEDKVEFLKQYEKVQKGNLTAKFWKTGIRVGGSDIGISHVKQLFENLN